MDRALVVNDLRIDVETSGNDIVDEVTLSIAPGEVLGLVGESGSGKTTVGLAVLGHARRGVKIASGLVQIGDADMLGLGDTALRQARGRLVTYVPQDPSTALNPAMRIAKQIMEVLEAHDFGGSAAARRARVVEVMSEVLLPGTPEFLRRYPHQLSRRAAAACRSGDGVCLPALGDRARRADHRSRCQHPGPRVGHGARPVPYAQGSPPCTSPTIWPWLPTWPTASQ